MKKTIVFSMLLCALSMVCGFGVFAQNQDSNSQNFKQREHVAACGAARNGEARCGARVIVDEKGRPFAGSTTPTLGYDPAQFWTAYGLPGLNGSATTTVAIVDAYDDPNIESDLGNYSSQWGLPACTTSNGCFQKVNQTGKVSPYPGGNPSWDVEIALDVETVHAICPNCRIFLVEANSASYADLFTAVNTAASKANVVSGSWGGSESSGETSYDTAVFKKYPNTVFTFSAGDSGYGTEYPAASPYVTAVGGTTLKLNPYGETVWAGTGSGCSAYEAKPSWQKDASCKKRTMNDVSADADPNTGAAIYDSVSYQGYKGWFEVGGTSLAAPLIAAVYAQSKIPTNNSVLYASASALHDVVSGSNGRCGGTYLCTAAKGYDAPTGLGTPNGGGAF